jgi:signal transduction histidine kinase
LTLLSSSGFTRALNARLAAGQDVALLAFRCRHDVGGLRPQDLGAYVAKRLRAGDAFLCEPRRQLFAVALLGKARGRETFGDAALHAAGRRIAGVMREATGFPFESASERIRWPLTAGALECALSGALDSHDERRRELAGIAHELRSPLSSIRGYLELSLECRGDGPSQLRFLETARGEALRLGRLLDGIIEFSLLEGRVNDDALSSDVAATIDRAVESVLPRAIARGADVRVVRRSRLAAHVAPDDCIRATTNILDNAINAGARRIEVASRSVRGRIVLTVDDDGPGIDPLEREAIFEPGRRGRSVTYAGSGLGLAAVKAIARSCGGSVSVDRSPLGGARFFLTFRRASRFARRGRGSLLP